MRWYGSIEIQTITLFSLNSPIQILTPPLRSCTQELLRHLRNALQHSSGAATRSLRDSLSCSLSSLAPQIDART